MSLTLVEPEPQQQRLNECEECTYHPELLDGGEGSRGPRVEDEPDRRAHVVMVLGFWHGVHGGRPSCLRGASRAS
jgi:hypothetical protein